MLEFGCESEKTDSDLNDKGFCPDHDGIELESISEENYFFKYSAFTEKLLDFYSKNPNFIVPDFRFNEMKEFVKRGLQDISISRLKTKMPWGIPVPGDDEQVMYVWFDALVNYISTLGWPNDLDTFENYWTEGTPVQYAGKDNLRQQSAMWQAMLYAAGLPNTHQVVINGFINSGGQKMSKSYGNTIGIREDADTVVKKIRTMQTDPQRVRLTDSGDPDKCPVWQLHEVYSDSETKNWVQEGCRNAGIGCLDCKKPVIEAVLEEQKPIHERAKQYEENPELVRSIIAEGVETARDAAKATLDEVKRAMGLLYR